MRESAQTCFGRTSAIGTSNRSGGMGRKELSANAIAASAHLPYRCSENVSIYRANRLRVTGAIISPVTMIKSPMFSAAAETTTPPQTSSLAAPRPSPPGPASPASLWLHNQAYHRHRSAHRALRQSADAKFTVPFLVLLATPNRSGL